MNQSQFSFFIVFLMTDFILSTVFLILNFITNKHNSMTYYNQINIIRIIHDVFYLILIMILFYASFDIKKNLKNTSKLRKSFFDSALKINNNYTINNSLLSEAEQGAVPFDSKNSKEFTFSDEFNEESEAFYILKK